MVSRALAAAWTRWQRLHVQHQSHLELGIAEAEAQFELVATGLVLSDEQVQKLFQDDTSDAVSLLTPLPTLESDEESCRRYHFALVAVGVLLDQFLQSHEEQVERLLKGNLTTNILLPVLQLERHSALHHAVLSMFQRLLHFLMKREDSQEIIKQLFMQVKTLLTMETEDTVSYDSLCRLLEFLLRQDGELVGKSVEICEQATRSCRQQPKFLRAVVLHIVPVLLEKDEMWMYQRLLDVVVNAAESLQTSNGSTFPQELLYLVCIIMPKAPQELIADVKLQKLVCFALRHDDSLLRKQGLHILKVAFSHCALLAQPQKLTAKNEFTWVDTWQNFLTASEVIQMHHEQHLIEQVWPQVENLLESYLIVNANSKVGHNNEQWPVQLTFDWMQSLLVRLFAHDNPVVKRLFISNFMESCVGAWQKWEKEQSACSGIEHGVSFACDPAFQCFVFKYLLRACNDPVLYKHAHRARFQAHVADFLSSFLAFQLAESDKDHVLDAYVAAMEEAIFGEGAENHSPEALLSMLQVFQSPSLKRAASSASTKLLLSASAVDRLRFLLDVHVMQSFSQAMRTKMLRSLCHALTGGFVNVLTLSLSLLSRVLCVFPAGMLMANNGETLLQFLAWMKGPSSSSVLVSLSTALKEYLKPQEEGAPENVLSPSQLARLLLFTAEMASESDPHHLNEMPGHKTKTEVVLRSPLSNILPTTLEGELESARLVLLVAMIEEQVQELVGTASAQSFTLSFERETFYDGPVNCSYLFACAMAVVRRWLDKVSVAPNGGDVESDDHEKENLMEHVPSAVFVLSQMSTYTMNTTGELVQMGELDALCDELKNVLTKTADHSVFDLALAAKCLSVVGANAVTLDSLRAFESERILPLLLALDTSRRYSGKLDARCAINLAASKWVLLHHVVESSSFIDTKLLRATYDACVEALPTAGMDPSALIDMVNVLSLTVSQLAGGLAKVSDGTKQFEGLLEEVWTAYCDSKAKPDALTRAVVVCMFQPVFLLRAELKGTVKRWIAEFIRFGSQHRPNVIFHLACRLCQTWRAHPSSALSFTDELIELLLYKEPLIDEKEQLTTDTSAPFQGFQGFSPINTVRHLRSPAMPRTDSCGW
ncbi:hypothetical protein DVH05_018935 [Phytophthora capsici]|nr:hypothetical protein DVH05_018935 [Phytophthora capsici]